MKHVRLETFIIFLLFFTVGFLAYKLYFSNNINDKISREASIVKALDKIQKSNSSPYTGYNTKKQLSIIEDLAEISGILDEKNMEVTHTSSNNSTVKNLNYIFNKNYKNTFIKESTQNEYTINSLVKDINEKEFQNYNVKNLSKTLEKKHIYVFLGHFQQNDAVKLVQYLEYQKFNPILKIIDEKYHFVLVKFETIKSANEFKIWAINQGFFDTKIIKN